MALQAPANGEASLLEGDLHYFGDEQGSGGCKYTLSALCYERAADQGSVCGMERLALQLISCAGIPGGKDCYRALQLLQHAQSKIASGASGLHGVQALLKRIVLFYRIIYVKMCTFLKEKVKLKFIEFQRVVQRIVDKMSPSIRRDRYLASIREVEMISSSISDNTDTNAVCCH